MCNSSEFYLITTLIVSPVTSDASTQPAEGTYTINKTFAELQDMYRKRLLTGLKWIQGDGTVVIMPLLSASSSLFTFSTAYEGKTSTFTLDSSDILAYTEVAGSTGGNAMKVVPLADGKPDVASPDPSIIYLTAGASAGDPYTRWIWSGGVWTDIGTTELNLDDCLLFTE